jgi:hypothetical protein
MTGEEIGSQRIIIGSIPNTILYTFLVSISNSILNLYVLAELQFGKSKEFINQISN